jgi:NTP pyrophosphatase (non-canonical NTP hydrolase)
MKTTEFERFVQTNWGMPGKTAPIAQDAAELRDLYIMSTGLAGETGEVMEHLKKYVRNGVLDNHALALELGDVLHYLTRIAVRFNFTLYDLMEMNADKLNKRAIERGWVKAHPNGSEE